MFEIITILLISFALSLVLGQLFIRYVGNYCQALARELTPANHQTKNYTPTMGGIFIGAAIIFTLLLCARLSCPAILVMVSALILFGLPGLWDDWSKITKRRGISERAKFIGQVVSALAVVVLWLMVMQPVPSIYFPLIKSTLVLPTFLFVAWAVWVIICTMNAVNFTDGLDGLAGTLLVINFAVFATIALHQPVFYEYGLVALACIGSLLGFLWFNGHPARVFMGDVGALMLGGMLALLALMLRYELLIPLTGIVFVAEGVSVTLQMLVYKKWGFRLFKMAPLHHHFELLGWHETTITNRFALVTIISCAVALCIAYMH